MVPPAATGSAYGHALVLNDRIGARPWVARTQERYAALLLERGERARAGELAAAAAATARELGIAPLAARAQRVSDADAA